MNIHPTRNKKAQASLVERTFAAIYRRLSRKKRIKALLTPLPRPGSRYNEGYLGQLALWMVVRLNTIKLNETYAALIGEPGTGKSTLIDRVAASPLWSDKGRAVLQVRLPALEDVGAWTELVCKNPTIRSLCLMT
jgi:hypothetical protein